MRQVNNANLVCESGWVKTDAAVRAEAVLVSEAQRSALRCRINLQVPTSPEEVIHAIVTGYGSYSAMLAHNMYLRHRAYAQRQQGRISERWGAVDPVSVRTAHRTPSVSKAQAREKRVYRSGRCSALRGGAFQCTACCRDCAGYNATRRAVSTARSSNWSRTVCAGAYTSVPGKMEAGKLAENGEAGPPALEEAWKLQSQSKRSKAIE
ncbi:hypothetical protein B0H13DRAFT_1898294 [Mycena leptocephala]|nr:hypothetical protein B0H13DRAFT_1898294 [Mycena leptocephala]